ncbi:hypothetical protein [Labilibaculum sp.]|uniref:hypothetical protein n=1 Tax=Labilibaculum sp. TaxID=2060723 RepID=UPI002AA8D160|nr:hypothetical protein [Labilibaculum sp.]
MQRIKEVLLVILVLIGSSCFAQDNCEKLLSEKIDLIAVQNEKKEFVEKIKILLDCSFDSVDKEVLLGNDEDGMIIHFLLQFLKKFNVRKDTDKNVTYGDLKIIIEDVIKREEFKVGRQIVMTKNKIFDKPATLSSWEEDLELLMQLNLTEFDITKIKKIIEENEINNWTYSDVIQELMTYYEPKNTMECPIPSYYDWFYLPHKLDGYFELAEGMECSRISNKPLLLYFTGHGSVESREFEAFVMSDSEILKLLKQKYVITCLYVDDKSKALPQYHIYSEQANDTIRQIGKINQYYQKQLSSNNDLPVLYIIDSEGNQLSDSYYFNESIDLFREFLTKGIESYYEE